MEKVIIASGNKDKIRELNAILTEFGFQAITKDEAGFGDVDPEETGETFEENSYIKAKAIMDLCGKPCIADDSGLEVFALDGAPGVYSGRFAGEEQNYEANNRKLLSLLEDVPDNERGARFVTVITMTFPDGRKIVARGECPGHIIKEPQGDKGFGYDPVFMPRGYEYTFAELGSDVKNKIGHRAQAVKALKEILESC